MDDIPLPVPGAGDAAGDAPAGDVKSEVPQVSLKVVNADGGEMYFKIKRQTQLKKLMDAYCKKQGIQRSAVRFLYDGVALDENKTPDDIKMEDDDVIDAMVEQTGGQKKPKASPCRWWIS